MQAVALMLEFKGLREVRHLDLCALCVLRGEFLPGGSWSAAFDEAIALQAAGNTTAGLRSGRSILEACHGAAR
jgi:hypothetical protein